MNQSTSFTSPLAKFKIVFLGDQGVGKTSIINKIMFDTFDANEHVYSYNLANNWDWFHI